MSARVSGLLLLVVVAVVATRPIFTARAARRWEAIDMDPYYDMCGISIRALRLLRILTDLTSYRSNSDTYGRWNISSQRGSW